MKCVLLLVLLGLCCVFQSTYASYLQKCHRCDYDEDDDYSDNSQERGKCYDDNDYDECDDDAYVCGTVVQNHYGKLKIKKQCMARNICEYAEHDNDGYCGDYQVKSGGKCTYCCRGDYCNNYRDYRIYEPDHLVCHKCEYYDRDYYSSESHYSSDSSGYYSSRTHSKIKDWRHYLDHSRRYKHSRDSTYSRSYSRDSYSDYLYDSREKDKCYDKHEKEVCRYGEVCGTRVEHKHGKIHVIKGCVKEHVCEDDMSSNDYYCDSYEVGYGDKCNYCCDKDYCNDEMGYRYKSNSDETSGSSFVVFSALTIVSAAVCQYI